MKPGIVYGNAMTAAAGFFLASRGHIDFYLFLLMLVGLSCVVASGCVLNNCIDRDIDQHMGRTKGRALVQGSVSVRAAIIYATLLGAVGIGILAVYTNLVTLAAALVGLFVYVVVYSLWAKRRTPYAAHIGSIAGAVPPVVGYCAVVGRIDTAACILFFVLCFWQMAHFFAIALYRLDEYKAAPVPVWPARYGVVNTKRHMLFYIAACIAAASLLWMFGYVGYIYLVTLIVFGFFWFGVCLRGFWAVDRGAWARKTFLFSLVFLIALCGAMSFV
jgi:heme o synthase